MGRFAFAHVAGDIGQLEELASRVAPAERADHSRGAAVGAIKIVVAAIGIRLQYAVPCGKMRIGMGLLPIRREVEECRRRRAARIRSTRKPAAARRRPSVCAKPAYGQRNSSVSSESGKLFRSLTKRDCIRRIHAGNDLEVRDHMMPIGSNGDKRPVFGILPNTVET